MRARIIAGGVVLTICLLLASSALADKLVCISNEKLRGEMTVQNCVDKGERFAMVAEHGGVRILNREEFELMKKLNPQLREMKAYGIIYLKEAPELKKLPPLAAPKAYQ
jgi:hypothetical protein